MKRFDTNGYFRWLGAMVVSGMAICLFGVCFLCLLSMCTDARAAAVESPTTVEPVAVAPVARTEEEPEVPTPVQEEEKKVDPETLEHLAIVIYREAGGDAVCDECRTRVADVALNRVSDDRFPDTLAEVLTQKSQYGTMYWDGIVWPERAENPGEAHAVERAYVIAEDVLQGEHSELYGEGYIFQSEFPKLGEQAVECCGIYYAKG